MAAVDMVQQVEGLNKYELVSSIPYNLFKSDHGGMCL